MNTRSQGSVRRLLQDNVYMILALAAAAVTAWLVFQFLDGVQQRAQMVIAARDLPEHTRLEASHLKVVNIEAASRHPQGYSKKEDLIGSFLLQRVFSGEPMLKGKISSSDRYSSVLGQIEKDRRAMFVPAPPARGAGGLIRPRQKVDLIFVPNEQKTGEGTAKIFLQNALVLDLRNDRGQSLSESDRESGFAGVLLSVTPAEAEKIAYALENGHVYVAVAGFEPQTVATSGAGLPAVMSEYGGIKNRDGKGGRP